MAKAISHPGNPSRQGRIRFSLLAVLAFVTICSLILAGWRITRRYTVTSYLRLREPVYFVGIGSRFSPKKWDLHKQTLLQLVTNDVVLRTALKEHKKARGSTLSVSTSELEKLRERLRVSFPGDGEILELRLDGKGLNGDPDREILTQIVDACAKELLRVHKLEQDEQAEKMKKELDILRAEAKEKTDQADRIESEEGPDSVDVRLLRSDIKQLIVDAVTLNRRIRALESQPPKSYFRVLQSPLVQYQ